ncbi:MAG: phosphomannose isomerase type II C-terminal cupin domain [Microthrixaceae bacterium]
MDLNARDAATPTDDRPVVVPDPGDRPFVLDDRPSRSNSPMFEERPWGTYEVLSDQDTHKVKTIIVNQGQRLSYQRHRHRSEHWFVISGDATVTLDGTVFEVGPGHYADIPQGVAHRLENRGDEPLVIIEVQYGDYFGEDDIIRLSDDYGRVE